MLAGNHKLLAWRLSTLPWLGSKGCFYGADFLPSTVTINGLLGKGGEIQQKEGILFLG